VLAQVPGSAFHLILLEAVSNASILCPSTQQISVGNGPHNLTVPPPEVFPPAGVTLELLGGSQLGAGDNLLAWQATFPDGHLLSCNFTVTVVDVGAPQIVRCVPNLTVVVGSPPSTGSFEVKDNLDTVNQLNVWRGGGGARQSVGRRGSVLKRIGAAASMRAGQPFMLRRGVCGADHAGTHL
jgi:hypothetical protein